jgi:hypothetical protein
MINNNRSKKSLVQNISMPNQQIQYNQQDPKLKNYYEAYEKNRLKSLDKYQSDLTKIYMVNPNMNSP